MNDRIEKLMSVYADERSKYEGLLALVTREHKALQVGCPLSDVIELLRMKKQLVDDIDRLEASISDDKIWFRTNSPQLRPEQTSFVQEMIAGLKDLVDRILSVEKENEQIILGYGNTGRGLVPDTVR